MIHVCVQIHDNNTNNGNKILANNNFKHTDNNVTF